MIQDRVNDPMVMENNNVHETMLKAPTNMPTVADVQVKTVADAVVLQNEKPTGVSNPMRERSTTPCMDRLVETIKIPNTTMDKPEPSSRKPYAVRPQIRSVKLPFHKKCVCCRCCFIEIEHGDAPYTLTAPTAEKPDHPHGSDSGAPKKKSRKKMRCVMM